MVKLLTLVFLLVSCAGSKKQTKNLLTIELKDNLFRTQNTHEEFITFNDELFNSIKKTSCLQDWNKTVLELKEKNKRVSQISKKALVWYELGNCYTLVGEFKKSIYYYDLVLGSGIKDTKLTSKIYYNMGQIYESSGQDSIALSFYKTSYELDDPTSLSLLRMALLNHKQGEFSVSNKWLRSLEKRFSKSETVNFLLGVNYYHLSKLNLIKSKVIKKLDEKSVSRALLDIALKVNRKIKQEEVERDLMKLELDSKLQESFRKFILTKLKG